MALCYSIDRELFEQLVYMKFEEFDLSNNLLTNIEQIGFKKATTIQQNVIPAALMGHDIMACAATGTGKTAAFMIPVLQYLIDFPHRRNVKGARVLILAPTRELAVQIGEHAKTLAKNTGIRIAYIIGGVGYDEQEQAFEDNTDIIVATPGRLNEYIRNKSFLGRTINILVIDEADRMLDLGFIDEVEAVADATYKRSQTMLFSATLEGKGVQYFEKVLNHPDKFFVESPRSEKKKIHQYMYYADNVEHKNKLLAHLLKQDGVMRTIIFVKKKEKVVELKQFLDSEHIDSVYLQGNLAQEKRLEAIEKFQLGIINVLVATDVASRGLDLLDISHVVNYDLPYSADIYVHRIGRTARAGKKGTAINLVEAHDYPLLSKFEHYTGEKISRRVMEGLEPKTKMPTVVKKKKTKDIKEPKNTKHKKVRTYRNTYKRNKE